MTKIVFIGAGSMLFGTPMFKDIFTCDALRKSTLALVDVDEKNLNRMYDLACALNRQTGFELKITKHLERREALPGADFVVNSLAVERCELWKKDFLIPKRHGIRHTLGENGGPGALFFSMRTIPILMEICYDMEELCPNAYLLNFSNPESRIVLAVNKYTKIRCLGLCHGIFMAQEDIAGITGVPKEDIRLFAAGMNHFQFIFDIRNARTGEDLYPMLREKESGCAPSVLPVSRKIFRSFGFWPSCSDDHIGEYLAWGYEGGEEGYDFTLDDAQRHELLRQMDLVVRGEMDLSGWLTPSGEKAVDLIQAIITGTPTFIPSAIVYNEGAISNLPADVAVEIPIYVDAKGPHKIMIGDLPAGVRALLSGQIGPQTLSVEAAVHGSRELAFQALLCDPVVNSSSAAEKILDELWPVNAPYIRSCLKERHP